MTLSTRYYPITTRLRNQAGAPIIGATNAYVSVLQLADSNNLADSRAVDLGLSPPEPVDGIPGTESVAMTDLRASRERTVQLETLETDMEVDYIDPFTFVAQVHVVDEVKVVSGLSTVTTTQLPIEAIGVEVTNATTSTDLTEGTNYTVNYVDGTVSFASGVSPGQTVHLTYRWLAEEKWNVVTDEEQTVATIDGLPKVILDNTPLDSFPISVYNVTQDADLVEGTDYTVDISTNKVTFLSGADVGDDVTIDYRWLDPTSDFWVNYETGILTRLGTLTDSDVVTFQMEYIWKPGIYGYVLDVSELPDGRYLVDIYYQSGSVIRVGDEHLVVRDGQVLDDFLADASGSGIRRVLLRTRRESDNSEVIGDVSLAIFDASGSQIVRQVRTNVSTGNVRLSLPEGEFEVYAFKTLVSFDDPATITVAATADEQVFTILGTLLASPNEAGVSPDCCLVYGNVRSLDCAAASGIVVRAILKKPPKVAGSSAILAKEVCVVTDSDGNFQIQLVRGTTVTFDIAGTKYESIRVVPDAESVFFDEMERG
jgi:hypothetical protein